MTEYVIYIQYFDPDENWVESKKKSGASALDMLREVWATVKDATPKVVRVDVHPDEKLTKALEDNRVVDAKSIPDSAWLKRNPETDDVVFGHQSKTNATL